VARWDSENKTLTLKIVFYGPALSGKTTNLIALHELLNPNLKGDMQILETKDDRTLFFDLLPIGIRLDSGQLIKLKVFTVPGQVVHNSTRKAVLSRADGIVFVADSQTDQSENNAESFDNLIQNTKVLGMNVQNLPLVIQFNKRDLTNIISEEDVNQRWNNTPWHLFFASALNNRGVVETFYDLLSSLYHSINEEYQLESKHGLSQERFVSQLIGEIS